MSVTYVDLFAGIGGFHAVGRAFGWENVFASEIDRDASKIYQDNWGIQPRGDITLLANDEVMEVPDHDVLFAGFPCQPFSKSGSQAGMDETRGTLFWNIAKVVEAKSPDLIVLENVRNLAGPRHIHEWDTIIATIRDLGYLVSDVPMVISPHKIHPTFGGRPQSRERIYICATKIADGLREPPTFSEPLDAYRLLPQWDCKSWDLASELAGRVKGKSEVGLDQGSKVSDDEMRWISAWDELQTRIGFSELSNRPGFPLWADVWFGLLKKNDDFPPWKNKFIEKNQDFFDMHRIEILEWKRANKHFDNFPNSRRKLEWQAGNLSSIWDGLIQLRPSGIRVKTANYTPAFVAMSQTSVFGPERRRLGVNEVAHLQGLPEWFQFAGQSNSVSYKQLGNGISITAAYHAIRAAADRDVENLRLINPALLDSIFHSPNDPTRSDFFDRKPSVLNEHNFVKTGRPGHG